MEISQFVADSPWAQMVGSPSRGIPAPSVQVFLATAAPIVEAEKERAVRAKLRRKQTETAEDPMAEEYRLWMEDNHVSQIVLAVRLAPNAGLATESEVRKMEEESYMQVGKRKVKMTGHFPPTKSDPHLRMAFPRMEPGDEKTVTFAIYVPGLPLPFREVVFKLKDMVLNGKLEL